MGYYTYYTLDVCKYENNQIGLEPDRPVLDEVVKALKESGVVGYAFYEDLSPRDAVKWYEHDEDMLNVSEKFPELIFCLGGEGEESADMWQKFYHNGCMQECQAEVVFPPFDPFKLTRPKWRDAK